MEEIVNLAVFEFDTTKLESSLDSLNKRLFELRDQQKKNQEQNKSAENEIKELLKVQDLLTNANQTQSKSYKENEERIAQLKKVQEENFKSQQKLRNEISLTNTEYNKTLKTYNTYLDVEGKLLTSTELYTQAMNAEVTSIASAREANSQILKLRNQLNPAIAEEAEMIKRLNEQYDTNTEFIRQNASAAEQQKMNIGNYKDSIIEAAGELNIFNGGFSGFIARSQEAGGVGKLVVGSLGAMAKGFMGLTSAAMSFVLTPIGAILTALVLAFGLVKNAMNRSEEATNKITKVFAGFGGIISKILGWLEPLGDFLIDVIVVAFEAVGKAAEAALEIIADGLEFLGFEDAAQGVKDFSNEMANASKEAQDLADKEAELVVAQRNARLIQLQYQKDAEKLRQIRDDESKSITERIKANENLGNVLQKQMKEELAIAQLQLDVVNAKIKQDGRRTELLDQQAEALVNIADIEERITGQQSEQLANLNSLRKEAADKEKERRDKAIQEALKNMDLELQKYILLNDSKNKSLQQAQKFADDVRDQELKKIEFEYSKRLISYREYEVKKLEVQKEYSEAVLDALNTDLDNQFASYVANNQRVIDENVYFNDTLYYAELDRLNNLAAEEKRILDERLANKLISDQEYAIQSKAIEDQAQADRDAVFLEREAAQAEKDAIDEELRRETNAANMAYDLEFQLAEFDKGYAARKAQAERQGADMQEFEKAEAEKRKKIERAVMDNKLQLASQTLGNIATIFGEESKAAKAAAVAQTTIDTYRAAQSAFTGMTQTIPGPVGIALGAVAAAAAVASGLANVKKIVSTKEPSPPKAANYARGVIGLEGAGSTTSDSIPANLSVGESVINSQSSSMFPNTLSAINMLGGGDGAEGSAVVQNSILQDALGGNFIASIAEAVAVGAAEGTKQGSAEGITGLSENRQIMNDAKF